MELLGLYDSNGKSLGKEIERDKARSLIKDGEHIATCAIFMENSEGKFLIQKTSKEKGGYYSTTGGHVLSNETPSEAIKREVLEELGIDISSDQIIELGYIVYDIPVRFLYYIKKDININDVVLQKEEVDNVDYMSEEQINYLIESKEFLESHSILFKELKKD